MRAQNVMFVPCSEFNSVKAQTGSISMQALSRLPLSCALAWTLVVVEVNRLFGSVTSRKGREAKEARLSW